MKKILMTLLVMLALCFTKNEIKAEGTATVAPNQANLTALALLPDRLSGSFLGCSQDNRIYFNIKDFTTENLYYGFNWQDYGGGASINNMYMRIFNPSGIQVGSTIHLPNAAGAGFISTHPQALAGPNIGGLVPAGYTPLTFTPTVNGDYWIEIFQSADGGLTQDNTAGVWSQSSYFDLTVATATNTRYNGRIHCDKWSYVAILPSTGSPVFGTAITGSSEPVHYAYTPDQVVMRLDFEVGFAPIAYNLAVNSYGVRDSQNNFTVTRRSINSANSPSLTNGYKIFLNIPDSTLYPFAAVPNNPTLLSPLMLECSPPYNIRYTIPQNGDVQLLFDINGVPGYQSGTRDRLIEQFNKTAGFNTYAWDGLDGLGGVVTSGTPLTIGSDLLVGRFNVPIYDAELNKGGFKITTERPIVIPNTRIFWDDSTSLPNVGASCGSATDNQNNTTGRGINNSLIGSVIPAHAWSGNGNAAQVIPAPAVGTNETDNLQCSDFGNVRVINSWGWGVKTSATFNLAMGCVSLSGTVWNDLNNSAAGTFSNIFTVGETGTNGGGLFAVLVDPGTGLVLANVPVNADGTYTINNIPATGANFPLLLSTTAGTVGSLPPTAGINSGWSNTSPVQRTVSTSGISISGLDFGILQNVPTANRDLATTLEDAPVTISVLTNDTFGPDGAGTGAITITDNANHGSAIVNDSGTPNDPTDDQIVYTPNANYNGNDTLIYQICDANGDCDTAVVYITINPVNDPPVAVRDLSSTNEDTPVTIPILTNDTDIDGGIDNTSVTITDQPNHGSVIVNPGGTITYTPNPNYNGNDTLIYQVCDLGTPLPRLCDTVIVYITINPVNDLPLAEADDATVPEDGSVTVPVLTNDTFGGDGPSTGTITVTQQPSNGTATVDDGGTPNDPTDDQIIYTPNPDFNGSDNIIYEICDSNGDCDTAIVRVTVTPVNDLPIAEADDATVPEDGSVTVAVLTNDTFGGDGPSTGTITVTQQPSYGTATVDDGGTPNDPTDDQIIYIPNPDFNGSDNIIYEICDSNGDCDTAIVRVTVTPVNDLPIAEADDATVPEDGSVTVAVLTNDTFGGDGPSTGTITVTQQPSNGTATVDDGGTPNDPTDDQIIYTPNADYNGSDQIIYEICDSNGDCDTAIVRVTVTPVNDLPLAEADDATVPEDGSVTVSVLTNDTFGGDGPSTGTVTIVTGPTNGTATVDDGGTPNDPTDDQIIYTPNPDFNGSDNIIYEICDSNGDCDTAIVRVTVTPVNDLPLAEADEATVPEDGSVTVPVLTNDTFGGDGPSTGTITIVTGPTNGTSSVDDGGTPNDPTDDQIIYTPNPDFNGSDNIIYEICDSNGDCDTAIVRVTVTPVNDLPIAEADDTTVPEDGSVTVSVLTNDTFGGDGPSTGTITVTQQPSNGTATVDDGGTPNDPTDDQIIYTPNADYNGSDQIIYEICDSNGDCDTAIVRVTVTPVNDLPIAEADEATVPEDGSVTVPVLTNDTFGGDGPSTGTITITQQPTNGTATVDDGGTPNDPTDDQIIYTPNADYNGADQIIYEICDSNGDCDTAIVRVTVTPVNDLPIAEADDATVPEDGSVTVAVLTNDTFGGDGPSTGTITIVTGPTNGTSSVDDGGTPNDPTDDQIIYTPNPDFNGSDNIIYEICDSNGDCDTAIVRVTVTPVNDLPLAEADDTTVPEDGSVTVPVLTNDTFGGDGPSTGTITIVTGPTNGTSSVDDGGTPNDPTDDQIIYTPNADYNGADNIIYEICDSNGDCDTAIVRVTVTPVNDLPTANANTGSTPEDAPVTIPVLNNDTFGGDGPSTGTITVTQQPSNGTATVDDGGTPTDPTDDQVVYTPNTGYNGLDSLIYEICDANGDCDTALVVINVGGVNDPPVVPDTIVTTPEDTPISVCLPITDPDFGDSWTVSVCGGPINGTLTSGPSVTGTQVCLTYAPNANWNGTDSICLITCDLGGLCDTSKVTIVVTPVNDLPIAEADEATVPEDGSVTVSVLTNDTFGGDGPSTGTITVTQQPTNGTATVDDGGTPNDPTDDQIIYIPNPDFNGSDNIIYEICDSNGDCDTAIVRVTLTPVNDLPLAEADDATVPEDGSVTVAVLTNDTFGGDGPSTGTITITQQPSNGTATVDDSGTPNDPTDDQVVYTPNADYNGSDQIIYEICDSNGDCDTAIVRVTVTPVNDLPLAEADEATVPEDGSVTVAVLTNDTFGGDGPSTGTITVTQQPSNGTATVDDGGTPNDPTDDQIIYTPNTGYNGLDSLIYEICDANGDCDTALVVINVGGVNDPPVVPDTIVTTPEDTPISVCLPITDPDFGDSWTVSVCGGPINGTLTSGPNVTGTQVCLTYAPNANWNGTDSICLITCDLGGLCDTSKVTIVVTPVNDLPIAEADEATVPEDGSVTVSVLTNDTFGGDGPSTGTITVTQQPTNGTATVDDGGTPNDPTDDQIIYIPNPDFNGSDNIIYEICDSNGDCDTAIVRVTLTPVNDLPLAEADDATVPEDGSVTVAVLTNDTFGGDGPSTGTITITQQPSNGTATVDDSGTPNDPTDDQVVYTPNADYNGSDQIIYEICDSNGDCDTAIVRVTVTPVNDLPLAEADEATVPEDGSVTVAVLTNDTFGGDGPSTGTITVTQQPSNGTATVDDGGTPNDPTDDQIIYTPNTGYNGLDSLIYEICDANGDCDTALVVINVGGVNDPPVVPDTIVTTPEDTPISVCLPITDPDFGDSWTVSVCGGPINGTLTSGPNVTGTQVCLTYAPNANWNGTDSICLITCDLGGLCDTSKVTIVVTPVNDLPIAEADDATVPEDGSVTVPVLTNDTFGGDGPSTGTITIVTGPTNGTSSVDDGGTPNDPTDDQIIYTPNADYNGADNIIYEICDSNGDCDTAIVRVTVTPVNDLPTANANTGSTPEDAPVTIPVLNNDTFGGDGPSTGTITVTQQPSNGTATVDDGGTPTDPTDDQVVYTPNTGYNGLDSLIYEICDANGDCDTALVVINVGGVNDPPVVPDTIVTTPEDTPISVCLPITDPDFGDSWTVSVCGGPINGTLTSGPSVTGTQVCLTYAPNANWNGTDSICLITCDLGGLCDTSKVTIVVTPVNDLPIAEADDATVPEDGSVTVAVLTNDTFGGDGPSTGTITVTQQPSNGTATVDDGGTPNDPTDDQIIYTPNPDFNGSDNIIYEICDSNGDCDTAIVRVTVTPVNDLPLAEADDTTVPEDGSVTVPVLTNDTFGGDGPSTGTITIVTGPTNGTSSVDDGGTPNDPTDDQIIYTPNADYNGADNIIYEICDSNGDCDTAIVRVTVTPVNDLPTANANTGSTPEDAPVTIPVLNNDTFGGDGPSTGTITVTQQPSNGTATVDDGGTPTDPTDDQVVYTPNTGYNGLDSLIYEICDANGDCDTALVVINVGGVNDPPVVPDTIVTTPEDTPITVCLPITDPDFGDSWTVSVCGGPINGTLTSGPSVTGAQVCLTYAPNANWNGTDSICLITCDLGGLCDTSKVTIVVPPVNDPPVVPDTTVTVPEDSTITVCLPITDIDVNDTHISTVACGPNHGTISGPVVSGNSVCVTYTPNANYNGTDSICVVVCDNGGLCDTGIIHIIIPPVNDPPVVPDTTVTVPEDSTITVCLPITDIDVNDTHTATVACGPNHGTISGPVVSGNSVCVTYTPNPNYNGTDSICVVVCDNGGLCDTGIIHIIIPPVNDPPVVPDTTVTVPEDSTITVCLPIIDIDGQPPFTVTNLNCTSNGTGTPVINGTSVCVTYTPNPDYNGTDSVCFVVCDSAGLCDTAKVVIIIIPTPEDTTRDTVPVREIITICDLLPADPTHIKVTGCDGQTVNETTDLGTWSIDPVTKCLVYTAGPVKGNDTLCIKVCDTLRDICKDIPVIITITGLPPIAVNDTVVTEVNTPVIIPVLNNDIKTDDDPLTLCGTSISDVIVTPPVNGTVIINNDGTITYTPNNGSTASDSFQYKICDPEGTSIAWVFISIPDDCGLPTVVTSNGDGINDYFYIPCPTQSAVEFDVFNRWGIEVYRSTNYGVNGDYFNGTYKGSPLPDGTYYYVIKYINDKGELINKASYLTLHR
ncbi:MAG: Ig-like domain-containing protein [Chitinophagales bacterium]